MFRPLLSSVPSTTFYGGKASSTHRSLISRNSSVTTSSNASSDQGTSFAPDAEGSDHHQEEMVIESRNVVYPDVQEEVFAFDKVDAFSKGIGCHTDDGSLHFQRPDFEKGPTIECASGDSEEFSRRDIDMEIGSASDFKEVNSLENTKVCSKCGCRYRVIETVEKDINLCPECSRQENLVPANTTETTIVAAEDSPVPSMSICEEYKPFDEPEPLMAVPEPQTQVTEIVEERVSRHEDNVRKGQTSSCEQSHIYSQASSLTRSVMEGGEQSIANQQGTGQPSISYGLPDSDTGDRQLPHANDYPSLKVDVSEGAGITILLKRSSSSKGPVVQGRTFIASTITYGDLSYARDSANSFRSSIGHGSTSASSSVDFNSARQLETRFHRQSSSKRSDMESYRYDINTRPQSTGSSLSGALNQGHHALGLASSTHSREDNVEVFVGSMRCDGVEDTSVTSHTSFSGAAVSGEDLFEPNGSSRVMDASASNLSCHVGIQLEENSVASFPNYENLPSYENEEDFSNNAGSFSDVDAPAIPAEPSVEVEHTMNTSLQGLDAAEAPSHGHLASISEIEIENCCQSAPGSENDDISTNSKSTISEFQDMDMAASISEHNTSDHVHGILGMFYPAL